MRCREAKLCGRLLLAVSILAMTACQVEAKTGETGLRVNKTCFINMHEEKALPRDVVIIETNRWKPNQCMWVAKKEELSQQNVSVIFPFAELFNAVCHIVVGESDSHRCYIHITPLTSFFRKETSELEKITTNLNRLTGKKSRWSFQVYYFEDHGKEKQFRSLIGKVLRKSSVRFNPIMPAAYAGGELNLILAPDRLSYSVQKLQQGVFNDVSAKGIFNKIPINAFE